MPPAPPNVAVRRFATVQLVSLAVKIAAVLVLVLVAVHYFTGGF